jgi:uncharacterized membrane protein
MLGDALFLAAAPPVDLARLPWSFMMAFVSLGLVLLLFRTNRALFEDVGLGGKEVALLVLGSIAGWAVNVPVLIAGGTYLAVNLGGAILPMILVAAWARKRKLRPFATLVGTALVAFVAWRIVEFQPSAGIVTAYPLFFLPIVVALAFALLVSLRNAAAGVPVAYASGSLGALIGADILHVDEIRAHFLSAKDNTIISIGGAGVFDMVFLAGTVAMALHLALVALLRALPRRATSASVAAALAAAAAPGPRPVAYPGRAFRLRDGRRAWDSYLKLQAPNSLERALAGLALSDAALREGDFPRSVRMSWLAVDSLLKADGVKETLDAGAAPLALHEDVARLSTRYRVAARGAALTLREAGEANATARQLLTALATRTRLESRLEGVA